MGWNLQIHEAGRGFGMASYGPALVMAEVTGIDLAMLERAAGRTAELLKAHPKGVGFVVAVAPNSPILGAAERDRAAAIVKSVAPAEAAPVILFEGRGAGAAVVRSVVALLAFVSAQPFQVCATGEQAGALVARALKLEPADAFAKGLGEAVAALRTRMAASKA